jgi:4,4'-diapophytoene synthase
MIDKQIINDYKQCEEVIKENSITFYKAFSSIRNKKQRYGVFAVYAFCRIADDLIDVYHDIDGLNKLEEELYMFKNGETPNHFMWRALRDTALHFYPSDYDYQPFFDMIKGQKMDIEPKHYPSLEALKVYCYHVASSVGLMLIPILSPKHYLSLETFAIELGYAMQLSNILRDIGEDYKQNRIYLPRDMMEQAGVYETDLKHGKINVSFIELFETLAVLAEQYFNNAINDLYLFPKDVRLPLGLSIVFYKAIIDACRHSNYDVFSKKNYVTEKDKKALIDQYKKQFTK